MNSNLYILLIFILQLLEIQTLFISQRMEENEIKIDDKIVIIHTNDVHCGLLDYIDMMALNFINENFNKNINIF